MMCLLFKECCCLSFLFIFFFFNDTATTEIYTLSLHDALLISDQIVKLPFRLREMPRPLDRGDDCEMVGDLFVVEYAFVRLDPAFLEYLSRVARVARFLRHERVQRPIHRAEVILG